MIRPPMLFTFCHTFTSLDPRLCGKKLRICRGSKARLPLLCPLLTLTTRKSSDQMLWHTCKYQEIRSTSPSMSLYSSAGTFSVPKVPHGSASFLHASPLTRSTRTIPYHPLRRSQYTTMITLMEYALMEYAHLVERLRVEQR